MTAILKSLVRTPPSIYPSRAGGKKLLFGPTFNCDRPYLCSGTWYQQSIYKDSPTCPQIWWTSVQKRLGTVGEFFPTRVNFRIGKHCQPYRTDVIQQTNFVTCYVVVMSLQS